MNVGSTTPTKPTTNMEVPTLPNSDNLSIRQQRRRLFRQMIRDCADYKHLKYKRYAQALRLLWSVVAVAVAIVVNYKGAFTMAQLEQHTVYWSPLADALVVLWLIGASVFLASFPFKKRYQMPLLHKYYTQSVPTTGRVVECEYARTSRHYKVVVVYQATAQGDYYAKVFWLKDLVEHRVEEFPLFLLPGQPTSAVSQRQLKTLKWCSCQQFVSLAIGSSAIIIAHQLNSWTLAVLESNNVWRRHRLAMVWVVHVLVSLCLGYWKIMDQNVRLLQGGARPVPSHWLPKHMVAPADVEAPDTNEIMMREPPVRNVGEALDAEQDGLFVEKDEPPIADSNDSTINFEEQPSEYTSLRNVSEPGKVEPRSQSKMEPFEVETLTLSASGNHSDDMPRQRMLAPNQNMKEETVFHTEATRHYTRSDSFAENLTNDATDNGDNDESLQQTLLENPPSPSSRQSLWDKLDRDYRKWLKSVHKLSSKTFETLGAADRLQLRQAYYSASSSSSTVPLSLWDQLDKDYQQWLQSTLGITSRKFNKLGLGYRLQLRQEFYNAKEGGTTLADEEKLENDTTELIKEGMYSKHKAHRRRRKAKRSKALSKDARRVEI